MSSKSPPFRFKQFDILQDQCAMKVGTDGILLGAWANFSAPQKILDIGTGTGLLALMMAQRYPEADITAVELDESASQQAKINVANSPWAKRIEVLHQDIRDFQKRKFDSIITNPPFFSSKIRPAYSSRRIARHQTELSYIELAESLNCLLNPDGEIAIILPIELQKEFLKIAESNRLFAHKLVLVQSLMVKKPNRALIFLKFSPPNQKLKVETLVIQHPGVNQYTDAYKALVKDFYLFM